MKVKIKMKKENLTIKKQSNQNMIQQKIKIQTERFIEQLIILLSDILILVIG